MGGLAEGGNDEMSGWAAGAILGPNSPCRQLSGAPKLLSLAWPRCTIVTDGTRDTYEHELAHCNGWWHAPFKPADPDPALHDFRGSLAVIVCDRKHACISSSAGARHSLWPCRGRRRRCRLA
jgi:hypothetical protein